VEKGLWKIPRGGTREKERTGKQGGEVSYRGERNKSGFSLISGALEEKEKGRTAGAGKGIIEKRKKGISGSKTTGAKRSFERVGEH